MDIGEILIKIELIICSIDDKILIGHLACQGSRDKVKKNQVFLVKHREIFGGDPSNKKIRWGYDLGRVSKTAKNE